MTTRITAGARTVVRRARRLGEQGMTTAEYAVGTVAAVAFAVPATRSLVRRRLAPVVGRAVTGLRDVLRSPAKIALLLGGSALVTLSYLAAFVAAAEAFGLDTRLAALGSVFLVGSAIAVVAPTPADSVRWRRRWWRVWWRWG